jgi:glycosyltransferase involved in cell wall biosynthesis
MRLIVFGHNDWWVWERQGFCTRNAALLRELARRDQVDEVLVVDTPRFRPRSHRPPERRDEDLSLAGDGLTAVRYDYPVPLPARWYGGRRLNERLAAPGLDRRLGLAPGSGPTVVWVADPRLMAAALAVPRDLLVFDAIDDWRQHAWAETTAAAGYALAARHADVVFAVNPSIFAWLRPAGRAETLFNAVDGERWAAARPANEFAGEPRPLLAYVGMLQSRVDEALLAAVARELSGATLLLIGAATPAFRAATRDLPANVRLPGARRYDELPGILAACDACIVPHRRDALTDSMDPLKLYEYLAAGRPTVTTVTSPNPRVAARLRLEIGAGAFARAVREELAGDDEARRAQRRAAVAGETWPARADRVLEVLDAVLARRWAQGREGAAGAPATDLTRAAS